MMVQSITTTLRQLLQESRLVNDAADNNGHRGYRIPRVDPLPESIRNGSAGAGTRKRINVSSIEKLEGDVSLQGFQTWRNRWNDLVRLEGISDHQVA